MGNKQFINSLQQPRYDEIGILMGQSNARGQASVSTVQQDIVNGVPSARIFTGNYWSPLSLANNYGSNTSEPAGCFGIELRLTKLLTGMTGKTEYLAKYAIGNTSLSSDWAPNGALYNNAISYTNNSKTLLPNSRFKYIIWIQGENDANGLSSANAYQANLTAFITAIRTSLNSPNLPFIIVSLSTGQINYLYLSTVVSAQQYVAANVPNCYIVNQNNVTSDNSHYTVTGIEDIANKCFNIIRKFY